MNRNRITLPSILLLIVTLLIFSPSITINGTMNENKITFLNVEEDLNLISSDLGESLTYPEEVDTYFDEIPTNLPFFGFIQQLNSEIGNNPYYSLSTPTMNVNFGVSTIHFDVKTAQGDIRGDFSLNFLNSHEVSPIGINKLSHPMYYFYGNDQPITLESWEEIWYKDLYAGIDLRYYMTQKGLKYDFIVHEGANPNQIVLQASEDVTLDIKSSKVSYNLKNHLSSGEFQDSELKVWQQDGTEVEAKFKSMANSPSSYRFDIGSFDSSQILTIDPLFLEYSTFLGGSVTDEGYEITVDSEGNAYVTGRVDSANFPLVNAYNATHGGSYDVFITKLNRSGNGIVFSTFIGGDSIDTGGDIKIVDSDGGIIVSGRTASDNFPTKNAYNSTYGGGYDGFVLKLNSTGNGLEFSTYFGGSGSDFAYELVLDDYGNIFIGGSTWTSTDFPLKNAYNGTFGGYTDAFIAKLNSTGNGLIYSTYIGGSDSESIAELALDPQGNIYFTGNTASPDFPTVNAIDSTFSGSTIENDAIIGKLGADGDQLIMSTFFGGSDLDYGRGIALDTFGDIYVSGQTTSPDFTTLNAFQSTHGGDYDAFVLKLRHNDYSLAFSSYYGGFEADRAYDIQLGSDGNFYINGVTRSSDIPLKNPYQAHYSGLWDSVIFQIDASGNLVFSSYIGGENDDSTGAFALDADNNIYLVGTTDSPDFPTKNAFNNTLGAYGDDAFVLKLVYDTNNPSIELTTPQNNSVQKSNSIASITVFDKETGIGEARYNWDNNLNITTNPTTGIVDVSVPAGDGDHLLNFYAKDNAGNWANQMYQVVTDDTPPTVGSYKDLNDSLILVWKVWDSHLENYTISMDGVLVDFGFDLNQTLVSVQIPVAALNLAKGEYIFTLSASDSAGNTKTDSVLLTIVSGPSGSSGDGASLIPGFELIPILSVLVIISSIGLVKKSKKKK